MKINRPFLLIFSVVLVLSSCKKTYEEGPAISFKTKFSRITGKWRLVSMEGEMKDGSPIVRLQPELDQFMELTKDPGDPSTTSIVWYRVNYTNFQEGHFGGSDSLFTTTGNWYFDEWTFAKQCETGEELKKDEGLVTTFKDMGFYQTPIGGSWKILKLKNNELKLHDKCGNFVYGERTLTFEKVKK